MKRGDIVVLNVGNNIGKPRPAVIIQADILNESSNVSTTIVLPLTSELLHMNVLRYPVEPSVKNGLKLRSQVMIDKIQQIDKQKIQSVIGSMDSKQIADIEARLLAVLGVN
jgi:mRNA interferase MazF